MALHTAETPAFAEDKDDPPSPNPHVHLIVQSLGIDGIRLNPRKADLHRWREGFARALREHGAEAVATSRVDRMQRAHGEKQVRRKMRERGAKFTKRLQPPGSQRNHPQGATYREGEARPIRPGREDLDGIRGRLRSAARA